MYWTLFALGLFVLGSAAYAASSAAPWVPTWKKDTRRITRLLNLQKEDRFVELGCGNGGVCRHLAKVTDAEIHGIELSVLQWLIAKVQSFGQKNVSIHFGNVFHKDLSQYTAVYLFLMPEAYKKMRPKFEQELKKGTRVVSYVWPIPGWTPARVDREEGRADLYLYIR